MLYNDLDEILLPAIVEWICALDSVEFEICMNNCWVDAHNTEGGNIRLFDGSALLHDLKPFIMIVESIVNAKKVNQPLDTLKSKISIFSLLQK
jgi:hypothetical protein